MFLPFDAFVTTAAKPVAPVTTTQQQQVMQVDSVLRVEYSAVEVDAVSKVLVFTGDVVATYGPTVVRTKQLMLNMDAGTGVAQGGVTMTDPEGYLEADHLEFDWRLKTGKATQAEMTMGNVRMWAEIIEIKPGIWTMTNARGTLSRRERPEFELTASSVTINPGRNGVARRVYLKLFGARLGPIPTYSFNLDSRLNPFKIPEIDYDREKGLGVSWGSSLLVQKNAVITSFASMFPNRLPSYGISLGYSPLAEDEVKRPIALPNDLGEFVSDGWFNSIAIKDPEARAKSFFERRVTYGVESTWNLGTSARKEDRETVSKMVDVVAQVGGPVGAFGSLTTARLQHIRQSNDEPFVSRMAFTQTLVAPEILLLPSVGLQFRTDAFLTMSNKGGYGWLRGEIGALYRPLDGLTIGTAISGTSTFGRNDFVFDAPPFLHVWHIRADYRRGPYTVRYMTKYDLQSGRWFDREYEFALVAQGFEPFIQYRQFPSDYRIGIRFRLDNFAERLTQRTFRRETTPPPPDSKSN